MISRDFSWFLRELVWAKKTLIVIYYDFLSPERAFIYIHSLCQQGMGFFVKKRVDQLMIDSLQYLTLAQGLHQLTVIQLIH